MKSGLFKRILRVSTNGNLPTRYHCRPPNLAFILRKLFSLFDWISVALCSLRSSPMTRRWRPLSIVISWTEWVWPLHLNYQHWSIEKTYSSGKHCNTTYSKTDPAESEGHGLGSAALSNSLIRHYTFRSLLNSISQTPSWWQDSYWYQCYQISPFLVLGLPARLLLPGGIWRFVEKMGRSSG